MMMTLTYKKVQIIGQNKRDTRQFLKKENKLKIIIIIKTQKNK